MVTRCIAKTATASYNLQPLRMSDQRNRYIPSVIHYYGEGLTFIYTPWQLPLESDRFRAPVRTKKIQELKVLQRQARTLHTQIYKIESHHFLLSQSGDLRMLPRCPCTQYTELMLYCHTRLVSCYWYF